MKAVLTALSGGVDSCVCAALLQRQGYDVRAVVMRMSPLHESTVEAAGEAARALSLPLTVLDLREEFEEKIVSSFLSEYRQGRTPNPCVLCNPTVKFRHLLAEAERQGCALAATGHYARVLEENGEYRLLRAASLRRDQSYMLYRLTQRELPRLLFPLGEMEKEEVREIAASLGLSAAERPDSQENCFIPDKDYGDYVLRRLESSPEGAPPPGDFIGPDGLPCGRHGGIFRCTVGQRRGLGVSLGRPVFVKRIDPASNRVYLADAGEPGAGEVRLSQVTTVSGRPLPEDGIAVQIKMRSAARSIEGRVLPLGGDEARAVFDTPQPWPAPGQSLVFYRGDALLGGGIIEGE